VEKESSGATGHVSASLSTGTVTRDRTVRTEVTNGTAVSTATVQQQADAVSVLSLVCSP
jgi:hypothetical protein